MVLLGYSVLTSFSQRERTDRLSDFFLFFCGRDVFLRQLIALDCCSSVLGAFVWALLLLLL